MSAATMSSGAEDAHGEILIVTDLSVRSQDKLILENLSFEVSGGTTLALVGPNGGGKTTLFRTLLHLVPYTGKIEWTKKVRIGYVPQTLITTDLPISVEEFLALNCRADFDASLDSVGLDKQLLKQPLGTLSGGQLQRVLIAWALLGNPDVLLLDEPTSGVDIGSEEPIYQRVNLLKEQRDITVLLITHNLHVAEHYSDHVLVLNRRSLFFGATKDLSHSRLLQLMHAETFDSPRAAENSH